MSQYCIRNYAEFILGKTTKYICMIKSSIGNIFRVTGHLCGKFTGPRWIPHTRPVTRSFGVFFDLRLNKRLSEQSWGWWFDTPSRPLWRHRNDVPIIFTTLGWHMPLNSFLVEGRLVYLTWSTAWLLMIWWRESQGISSRGNDLVFIYAKPWMPGGEKSIFTVVIHQWRSPSRQFARARTIDEYDFTMPVPRVRVTSHIDLWWRHSVKS